MGNGAEGGYLKLLPAEVKEATYERAISALTFYEGEAPIEYLKAKTEEILTKNLWLTGEYRKHPETKEFPSLFIKPNFDINKHFQVIENLEIDEKTKNKKMTKIIEPFLVNQGKVGRAKAPNPIFKVIIVKNKDKFAVILSMCHSFADAATYYNIYNMLDIDTAVTSLNPERKDITKEMLDFVGEKKYRWVRSALNIIVSLLQYFLKRNKSVYFYINQEWVDQQKQQHKPTEQVPYISTNDIMSSTIFNIFNTSCGILAFDPRGKVGNLENDRAGYYASGMIYRKKEYSKPEDIRLPFTKYRSKDWDNVPTFFQEPFSKVSILSNWAKWKVDLKLKNCKQIIHLPLFAEQNGIPTAMAWKPNENQIGIAFFESKAKIEELKSHPIFGISID